MIARTSWAGVLLFALLGCNRQVISFYYCDNPDKGHKGPDGEPDPCHYQDADAGPDGGEDGGADGGEDEEADGGEDGGADGGEDGGE